MTQYRVCYRMVVSGSILIEASSREEAESLLKEGTEVGDLTLRAGEVDVEATSVKEDE
jgi:hypothetical protein